MVGKKPIVSAYPLVNYLGNKTVNKNKYDIHTLFFSIFSISSSYLLSLFAMVSLSILFRNEADINSIPMLPLHTGSKEIFGNNKYRVGIEGFFWLTSSFSSNQTFDILFSPPLMSKFFCCLCINFYWVVAFWIHNIHGTILPH